MTILLSEVFPAARLDFWSPYTVAIGTAGHATRALSITVAAGQDAVARCLAYELALRCDVPALRCRAVVARGTLLLADVARTLF